MGTTRQEQQQTSTSLNWQEIKDVLHDYKLMVDGASDGLWIYNVSSDRYSVSKKDRERFDFDPNLDSYSLAAWQDLLHPDDEPQALQRSWPLWKGQAMYMKIRIACARGWFLPLG